MAIPVITIVSKTSYNTRYKAVGEPTAADWIKTRRLGREPWCEFTIWHGQDRLSSFGGELWPSAWPELFAVGSRTIYGQETKLTQLGRDLIARAAG